MSERTRKDQTLSECTLGRFHLLWILLVFISLHEAFYVDAVPLSATVCTAVIDVTYRDPTSGHVAKQAKLDGRYGLTSRRQPERGRVVHVITEHGFNDGCTPAVNVPDQTSEHWIALVQRGGCRFADKVLNAVFLSNASAVVVYNDKDEEELITMNHDVDEVVSVFIQKRAGEHISQLVDSGLEVYMNISVGYITIYEERSKASGVSSASDGRVSWGGAGNTPVLAVSLVIIVVLMGGLVGLLVYAVRRSRRRSQGHQGHHGNQTTNIRPHTPRHVVFLGRETFQAREGLLTDITEQEET